ncbi:RNA polymerase sigma factor [Fulvivirga sediminis]|uniref:RNA polymerase sigma factor n=1 Tax=Fulvivirga sediminis TaxID=2803949 RepID=A0A937FD33_9BACT|nr:RNA polymerase sigma factor [Fulvivirga sediminis]MBL3658695.1 RNA polymerase sigma factor [Fulvivirga sediminis]
MTKPIKNIHESIINNCLAGNRQAYGQLYQLYSKAMFNICLRMVNDRYDAEDVLQEAFVSAFNGLRSYKGDSTFGAWLKRIVINKSINFIQKRKLSFEEYESEADHIFEETLDQSDDINYQIDKVKEAMGKLPDGYRVVFSLYLLEGYDHSEIADILKISESTSKSQLNRAKAKLKQILLEEMSYER